MGFPAAVLRLCPWLLGGLFGATLAACGKPAAKEDPRAVVPASRSSASVGSAAASAPPPVQTAPPAAQAAPLLTFVPWPSKEPRALHAIEGALLVSEKHRVGRLVLETGAIEPVGKVREGSSAYGPTQIYDVLGRWPDRIDVLFHNTSGRGGEPTYFPLVGKGVAVTTGAGGGLGYLNGVATIGDSTLLSYWSVETGSTLRTVRGKALPHHTQTEPEAGCREDERVERPDIGPAPALAPTTIAATRTGILVSIGRAFCNKRGPAAEIWDDGSTSRIVSLADHFKKLPAGVQLLAGADDELFVFVPGGSPLLRFRQGTFTTLPTLPRPAVLAFVSDTHVLHVFDGERILRLDESGFVPVARFPWPRAFRTLARVGDAFFATDGSQIGKLVPAPSEASTDLREPCEHVFVHVSDASPKNEAGYAYPATRRAIASFPESAGTTLVEVVAEGTRRVGVVVGSRAQGEALIAHLGATMKEERPRLLCFEPKTPRILALASK